MLLLLGRPPELQQDRTVATLRTIFIGKAACLLPAFHNFCNKVKTKKHDRYLLTPSWGRKSLSLLTSILNNCNSYKYLTTEPGYISYAFYTAGINCLSNWIKRPAKMVGKRCLHLFWVKVSFSCPLSDKERKKWSRYIAILSFHRGRKILEKFRWDLLFALSTRVNLFMSVQCYGLHGNWKGHNKSKPPFMRIKKQILWETLTNRQNHIKVSST